MGYPVVRSQFVKIFGRQQNPAVLRKIGFAILSLLILCLSLQSSKSAEMKLISNGPEEIITIFGEIQPDDGVKFLTLLRHVNKPLLSVYLDGPGGDVAAAMDIGRRIRSVAGSTVIWAGRKCVSSCALIFVAGVQRDTFRAASQDQAGIPDGMLGLHRPYLIEHPGSEPPSNDEIKRMYESVQEYLSEMNITPRTFEIMMNTPPETIHYISGDAIFDLIPKVDPFFDETEVASEARRYGIDTATYRLRRLLVDRAVADCSDPDRNALVLCVIRAGKGVILGVSAEMSESEDARFSECGRPTWSNEEFDEVLSYEMNGFRNALESEITDQWRWKYDHPLQIAAERCRQDQLKN